MPECETPLWPCAMTGAAACLAGFEGISVVIHGSSGCYYYPATLLHAPLHGTFILENEVVFGSGDRLREVIGDLSGKGGRIAVITTCVPSLLGEDIKAMLDGTDVILVDSPGFAGELETGYRAALAALAPVVDPERRGVNIDGVSLSDPFYEGNMQEVSRSAAPCGCSRGNGVLPGLVRDGGTCSAADGKIPGRGRRARNPSWQRGLSFDHRSGKWKNLFPWAAT